MPVRDVLNLKTASAEGIFFGGGNLVGKLCLTLETLWTVACQAPLSTGFSRQEYWSVLPCPPPRDLPNSGIEPRSPVFAGRFFAIITAPQASVHLSHQGSPSILQ